ncbi:hypothetical protein WR25_01949 [Diploscapter pachys]|uniref:Uncharacterized protein n=1 Tax=Diploscapter pachys TaxID=2018661 RepID=A0A2A2LIE3_9BILA|nr:hypothetical protein WR25_01949 [Diploscapter pachys]
MLKFAVSPWVSVKYGTASEKQNHRPNGSSKRTSQSPTPSAASIRSTPSAASIRSTPPISYRNLIQENGNGNYFEAEENNHKNVHPQHTRLFIVSNNQPVWSTPSTSYQVYPSGQIKWRAYRKNR